MARGGSAPSSVAPVTPIGHERCAAATAEMELTSVRKRPISPSYGKTMTNMGMKRADRDQSDIAAIVLRYKQAVHSYFLRRVGDVSEAEDLTQDVFAALARRADLDAVENVEGYVFQVAANLLRDRYRRARVRPNIASEGFADPFERLIDEISPEREAIGRDCYLHFVQALEMLPERPRMVLQRPSARFHIRGRGRS